MLRLRLFGEGQILGAPAAREPGLRASARPKNPRADGLKQLVRPFVVWNDTDVVFGPDLVDRSNLLLLGSFLQVDSVDHVDRESKILCKPYQGRPLLVGPLDGGPQAKSQLRSAVASKGVIALGNLASLLPRLREKVGLLADLLHGPYGLVKQMHP